MLNAPSGISRSTLGALEDFATGIRDADAMLGRLTDYFSQVDEPVVLVFWGDHYITILCKQTANGHTVIEGIFQSKIRGDYK